MLKYIIAAVLVATSSAAHEMTPTYFDLKPSIIDTLYTTQMKVFNRRNDASFYRMEAYTEDWEPLPYASFNRQFTLDYGEGIETDLYFSESDLDRIVYICSRSIPRQYNDGAITSLICSKIRKEE